MNKKELIEEISKTTGLSQSQAGRALDTMLMAIKSSLDHDDKVTLPGFGSFSVASRQGRKGRNPRTGQSIDIPATRSPKFTPGKDFKDLLNAFPPLR